MLRANDYLKCGGRKQLFEWWIRSCPLNFAIISGFFFKIFAVVNLNIQNWFMKWW